MTVFLCVLFKTDGQFTLTEVSDKQLGKDGGGTDAVFWTIVFLFV